MAFLLNKTTIASHFRSHSQKTQDLASFPRRRFHVQPGAREKALLAEDSSLKPFKSYKKSVKQLKKIGNVLTVVVVAGWVKYAEAPKDAVTKYTSELLQGREVRNSNVLKVLDEAHIGSEK